MMMIEEPSGLDEATKAALDDTAQRCLRGKTIIYLPGRLSTLRICDRILLFDGPRLVANEKYNKLIQQSELLQHLVYTRFAHRPQTGAKKIQHA